MILNDSLASVWVEKVPGDPGTNQTLRHRSGYASPLPWGHLTKACLGRSDMC